MNNSQNELSSFHEFLGRKLTAASGLSPEEALDLWRSEHRPVEDDIETVAALRQAIADMHSGDIGMPIGEFDRQFRAKRSIRTDK